MSIDVTLIEMLTQALRKRFLEASNEGEDAINRSLKQSRREIVIIIIIVGLGSKGLENIKAEFMLKGFHAFITMRPLGINDIHGLFDLKEEVQVLTNTRLELSKTIFIRRHIVELWLLRIRDGRGRNGSSHMSDSRLEEGGEVFIGSMAIVSFLRGGGHRRKIGP